MSEEVESHILERYEILQRMGKGAYGIVWKAMDKKYKQVVAVKKVFEAFRNSTDAQRTYREIIILQGLNGHDNIIRLRNVIRAENNMDLYLVFEYMEADLHLVIRAGILEDVHRQYIIYQILKSLKYVHSAGLVHRDLKPANVLINSDVSIKVADFGLARSVAFTGDEGDYKLSEYVATRWYRAPEILLGSSKYSKAVDMWSVGCILGELLVGKPIFQGKSSLNQIEKVLELVGKPKSEDVEAIDSQHAETILSSLTAVKKRSFQSFFPDASEDAMDLLKKLLTFNPHYRITVEEALKHKYVAQFSSPDEEIVCDEIIEIPIDDFTKLSTKEYREAIYAHIAKKKRERRRKVQERYQISVGGMTDITEKPPSQQSQQAHQPQQQIHQERKLEKSNTTIGSNIIGSKSTAQSPSHSYSKSQVQTMASVTSGVKPRPSRVLERSNSNYTKGGTVLSASLLNTDDKAGSPLIDKKLQSSSKTRHVYVGKTEGDLLDSKDHSGFKDHSLVKQSSMSPQRMSMSRKTYYVGGTTATPNGTHLSVKNLLKSTGTSSSKVLSSTGNSFILKKK